MCQYVITIQTLQFTACVTPMAARETVGKAYHTVVVIIISNPKQPAVKKVCGPQKGYGEKRCEIQGGGQEMAVMVG